VLRLATSLGGRQFAFQASLHNLVLQLGGFVVVHHDGRDRIGQVFELESAQADAAELVPPLRGAQRDLTAPRSAARPAPSARC
jgi:hypothetical protein